jgi:hypothetical protein
MNEFNVKFNQNNNHNMNDSSVFFSPSPTYTEPNTLVPALWYA